MPVLNVLCSKPTAFLTIIILREAHLLGVHLERADLSSALLLGAHLEHTHMERTNLANTTMPDGKKYNPTIHHF